MTSNVLPAFSIIIPVFNGQHVIGRCIDSVLGQRYQNFELILIDDGSTDQTQRICCEYQAKNERIKYHYQINRGVSSARNHGLSLAQNEYILFVDADDYLLPDFLSAFESKITQEIPGNKTFIFQDFIADVKLSNGQSESFKWCKFTDGQYNLAETFEALGSMNWMNWGVPFAKVYRRSIINSNNIRFNEKMSFREDLLFMLDYMGHVDNLIFDSTANYCYIIDNTKPSLSKTTTSFDNELIFFNYSKKMANFYIDKYQLDENIQLILHKMVYSSLFRCINSCMYKYKIPMSKADRIKNIKLLCTKENLNSLFASEVIDSKIKKVAFTLLKNKLYNTYDAVNSVRFAIA